MRVRFAVMGLMVALAAAGCGGTEKASRPEAATTPAVLAETPPMGWNSWNCFGVTVTEEQVRANADYMAEHLKAHGWEYVVVDLGWYLPPEITTETFKMKKPPQALDAFGRLVPDTGKFPSAAEGAGFKPLADYVHGLGLKFGIHIMRGIPWQAVEEGLAIKGAEIEAGAVSDPDDVCEWYRGMLGVDTAKPGGQEYYDSLIELYAGWGVDYIKADDMSRPYHEAEITALANAIRKVGRPIVLSLSPGATPIEAAEHVSQHANLWRISPDFWDYWPFLERQFELCRLWESFIQPGHWPDADMLPLGKLRVTGPDDYVADSMGLSMEEITNEYSRFTTPEKYTMMTLWSIFRSPLMMGGHLPENDDLTLELLTNDEVLAVNQRSTDNHELFTRGHEIVWVAEDPDSEAVYVAFFNTGDDEAAEIEVTLDALGLDGDAQVRNLWAHEDLGPVEGSIEAKVEPHGAVLLRVSPAS
jgi:alpha-galactosidase